MPVFALGFDTIEMGDSQDGFAFPRAAVAHDEAFATGNMADRRNISFVPSGFAEAPGHGVRGLG